MNKHDEEDQALTELMRGGLQKLDMLVPDEMPNLQWMEQIVADQQNRMRKKMWTELAVFWLVAMLVLSGVFLALYANVYIFAALQAFVVAAAVPVAVILRRKEQVKTKWKS